MRVAICGGGLFGCTAAIYAARAGHDVHLFEARDGIMQGASATNSARLHRGAHYPRSSATGLESRRAERSFRAEYGEAVIDGGRQLYIVPSVNNHVTVRQFAEFLDNESLPFSEDDGIFTVEEPRINLAVLADLVKRKVAEAGVNVHLNTRVTANTRDGFDLIIVATYASLNSVLSELGCQPAEYRFQVVEKPIVRLSPQFRDTSIVVIDGPFGCIDPYDDTEYHALGHVTETIHAFNTGIRAIVPPHLVPLVNEGFIPNAPYSRWREVAEDLARYIHGLKVMDYLGSAYTVRAVLAHKEATDERPSIIRVHDEKTVSILSGKLGTAVTCARELCDSLVVKEREAA